MNTLVSDSVLNGQIGLRISNVTATSCVASWDTSPEFDLYSLQDGGHKTILLSPTASQHTITGLQPGTQYYFYVRARRASDLGWTPVYQTTPVKTLSSTFPIWVAELTRTSLKLHWDSGGEIIVLQRDGYDGIDRHNPPVSYGGLTPGQLVKFRLRRKSSPEWNDYDVVTLRNAPTPPKFLDAYDQTSDRVSLYWDHGTVDGGQPRYRIERDGKLLEIKDRPPYTDTTPEQGRSHVYSVQTMDDQFNLSEKISITVRFGDFTAPTDPSNLSTSHLTLIVKWDESYDSSGEIFYDVDQDGEFLGTTKEEEFAVTGLETGKRYTFGVTAKDPTGNKSNRVTVTYPPIGIPSNTHSRPLTQLV
ncbi:hypothetical protein DOZ80_30015 [Pseudomonas fluorescens]|uniref:Fibronectin type-III domain-containing protein n=1 Tax=Pseudomonas fluorescens TaxID=294 RepID=A0A327MRE3_PSEFL|nr:fibronectin type III domain-containing protein [Pseudomonas fluorescens]RAI62648.1 hypothetical protein DOZ80_30015 [Pseudomonas fluorescens]